MEKSYLEYFRSILSEMKVNSMLTGYSSRLYSADSVEFSTGITCFRKVAVAKFGQKLACCRCNAGIC